MRAFVFAAGRGERLRPLTEHTPKPLIRVGDQSLIERLLRALQKTGVGDVVINLSHLGAQIRAALGDGSALGLRIHWSEEGAEPLETAGGLRHALHLLGGEPFIAVNGDVFTDFDFARLPRAPEGLAHLLLVDNPPHHPKGDFQLSEGRVLDQGNARLTFSGIAVYRPELIAVLPEGRAPLAPLLRAAMARGLVSGEHHPGLWIDVGSPERLEQARALCGETCE